MQNDLKKETGLRATPPVKTVLIVSFILVVLFTGFAIYEYNHSQKDLITMMQSEGYILLDALMISSERSIQEYEDLAFTQRTDSGPGVLINHIMKRDDIRYIVLQDDYEILMSSEDPPDLDPVIFDPFLLQISIDKSKGSRILNIGDSDVFEICGTFFFNEDYIGLFRIGLKMDQYHRILKNIQVRYAITAIIFIFAGVIAFSLIVATQNARILNESYQRVKTYTGEILENLKDAVITTDNTGKITLFNQAASRLFEIPAKKMIGKSVYKNRQNHLEPIIQTLETGKSLNKQLYRIAINKNQTIINAGTTIIPDDSGNIETVILIATDQTRQSFLEEQVQRQEKLTAMGELASGVAHEIRNPINAIGMIAQRLKKEFQPGGDNTEYNELISSVVQETKRIDKTIRQFLSFAKPAPLNKESTDMKHFLNDIAQFFKSSCEAKEVHFSNQINANQQLTIDRVQMRNALLNLLQNSLDAIPSKGQITFSSHSTNEWFSISVRDTGSGISAENKSKIFDLYFTTKTNGTGIGLAVVNQIIQQHNGNIIVEPNGKQGTVFTVQLPIEEKT